MPSKVFSPALFTMDGRLIEIECDLANGLPGFVVVGLAHKAVDEARERVRSALRNSGLYLPPKRVTLNMAPADIPKEGTGYDLGLAVAVLVASGQLEAAATDGCLFLGELALDGSVRPVPGALLAAQLAAAERFHSMFVPAANAAEAAAIGGVKVRPVGRLLDVYRHLSGQQTIPASERPVATEAAAPVAVVDLADVYGQPMARRAVEIAAAGGHNLLLSGPPGAGKTMLARTITGLLPPLTPAEAIEVTRVHSLAGIQGGALPGRPFRAPHHTASQVALIGGGSNPRPGEISLSHHGVLFLDELPEFPRAVTEVLRQPLEDQSITVARVQRSVTFPADFMLVATANPCPCGYFGDENGVCSCKPGVRERYRSRLSGPLLDRIDLIVDVPRVERDRMVAREPGEPSGTVAARVAAARERQHARTGRLNARLTNPDIAATCRLDDATELLAKRAITALGLSARSYGRTLKVARTIADLTGDNDIRLEHFTEALQFRPRERRAA